MVAARPSQLECRHVTEPHIQAVCHLHHQGCTAFLRPEPLQHQFLQGEVGSVGAEEFGFHFSAGIKEGPATLTKPRQIFSQSLGSAPVSGSLWPGRGRGLASPQGFSVGTVAIALPLRRVSVTILSSALHPPRMH